MALNHNRKIAVIGLGYVGLPVAVAFARAGAPVIGFDIDKARIEELRAGHDRTHEVERNDLGHKSLTYSHDGAALNAADFFIVTVPTPIDSANRPDLGAMLAASRTVGGMLKMGDIVVYESTVYPGAIEEDCVPVLEEVHCVVPASEVVPLARPVKSSSQKVVMALAETDTDCCALQPLAGLVTVTVYVPAAQTVGFCTVELKLLGPAHL